MRKFLSFLTAASAMAVAVILGGASPAAAAAICPGMITVYQGGGARAVDAHCEVTPGYEVGAGAGAFSYSGMAGAGAGAGVCYPASNPEHVACINPQSFVKVDTSGNVFVLNSVCYYPYPCDWVLVYALPGSGVGVDVYEYANGIHQGLHIPL